MILSLQTSSSYLCATQAASVVMDRGAVELPRGRGNIESFWMRPIVKIRHECCNSSSPLQSREP